jgi:hypothetical protein
MEEGSVVDPKMELAGTKCAELFAESIPGEFSGRTALLIIFH